MRTRLTNFFYVDEFVCPCCGAYWPIAPELLEGLRSFRYWLEGQVRITEGGGCRCFAYHSAIYTGRRKPINYNSGHLWMRDRRLVVAADISLPGHEFTTDVKTKIRETFNGIGWGDGWTHVDMKERKKEWSY